MIVSFDNKPTTDWKLRVTGISIPMPNPQYTFVSVPGRNGSLDFSEVDGVIYYDSRDITVTVSGVAFYSEWFSNVHSVAQYLHGIKRKMILSDDPNYYYLGRFSVSPVKSDEVTEDVTITGKCDPYKYKLEETVVEQDVSGSAVITLVNEQMPVVPTVTADSEMQLVFTIDGTQHSVSIGSGEQRIPDLFLKGGTYEITVNGTGHIKFSYQEGAL